VDEVLLGHLTALRRIRVEDLPTLREWYNRPDVFPYMGRAEPLSEADQQRWYASLSSDPSTQVYAVVGRHSEDLLGSITLRNLLDPARRGELGILMGAPGSGFGSDAIRTLLLHAFRTLDLQCVSLEVRGDNRRAITAYMRAGFRPEGVLRRRLLKGGVLYDLFSLSILREEFLGDADSPDDAPMDQERPVEPG
jgi:RimJ/RimL family protein N-acetyltransferase